MSMSTGGGGGLTNEINVTPMIDVLLVLLIIFMVIIPMSRKVVDLQLPDPNPAQQQPADPSQQIVLEVLPNSQFSINREVVSGTNLMSRLKEIYDPRPDKLIFIKGEESVTYQSVIWAIDQARGAGVKVIGVTPKAVVAP